MASDVLEVAREGLEEARQHPLGFFDWKVRREIYRSLNVRSELVPDARHQSLAIQAAEHVISLFVPIEPDDQLVYQLLESARAFMNNQIELAVADQIEDQGYHAGEWFGYNFETETINHQSSHAGFAAYKALVEVRHLIDPWEFVEYLSKGDGVMRFGSEPHPDGWTAGADFTDEQWCRLAGSGDTAAAAAFAYATTTESDQPRRGQLVEFWEWWVNAALPRALKAQPNVEN